MTNEWTKSATNEVLYPDDLAGYGPLEVVEGPIEAEEANSENAQYGKFAVLGDGNEPDFMATPRQLRAALGALFEKQDGYPLTFEVLEAEKGPRDDSEWRFEVEAIDPTSQDRF